jgi:hypothetical protein
MVAHQAVAGDPDAGLACVPGEQLQVEGAVGILEEDGLTAISSLGNMMPAAWNYDAGDASHE